MSDANIVRLLPALSRVEREVLTLVPNEVTPLSSRHIHVVGARPMEVSRAVRQLIVMNLIEAEYEGIYDGVISYQILWHLPLAEEVIHRPPKKPAFISWLGLSNFGRFILGQSKWKLQ